MKAIPTTYLGVNFRSKLEARYYIHFKNLGWKIDYEPEVPGLMGYQPDFVIYPDKERHKRFGGDKPIYVEVKPLADLDNFYSDDYSQFRQKVAKVWDPKNDLIVVGVQLFDRMNRFAIAFCLENKIYNHISSYQFYYSFADHGPRPIGAQMFGAGGYEYIRKDSDDRDAIEDGDRNRDGDGFYSRFKDSEIQWCSERSREILLTSWNKAWSKLQWKPK